MSAATDALQAAVNNLITYSQAQTAQVKTLTDQVASLTAQVQGDAADEAAIATITQQIVGATPQAGSGS